MPISLFTGKNSENHFSWGHFIKKENKYTAVVFNWRAYTIRLTFSNFFIHHYFQNQMFANLKYAFNMSSDAQIHVSRRVCVLFSRPRVATLRLRNHANSCPAFHVHHMLSILPCLIGKSVIPNKPEWHLKNSARGRRHGLTLNQRNMEINKISANMKKKEAN